MPANIIQKPTWYSLRNTVNSWTSIQMAASSRLSELRSNLKTVPSKNWWKQLERCQALGSLLPSRKIGWPTNRWRKLICPISFCRLSSPRKKSSMTKECLPSSRMVVVIQSLSHFIMVSLWLDGLLEEIKQERRIVLSTWALEFLLATLQKHKQSSMPSTRSSQSPKGKTV